MTASRLWFTPSAIPMAMADRIERLVSDPRTYEENFPDGQRFPVQDYLCPLKWDRLLEDFLTWLPARTCAVTAWPVTPISEPLAGTGLAEGGFSLSHLALLDHMPIGSFRGGLMCRRPTYPQAGCVNMC